MPHGTAASHHSKISREFAVRLERFKSRQKVRAIVLLQTKRDGSAALQPRSQVDRKAALATVRQTTEAALEEIDIILKRFHGRRLSEATVVGSIPVETTPAGILALADSEHVKAILEDQPISLLSKVGT